MNNKILLFKSIDERERGGERERERERERILILSHIIQNLYLFYILV